MHLYTLLVTFNGYNMVELTKSQLKFQLFP